MTKATVHTSDPHKVPDSRPIYSHVTSAPAASRVVMTAGQVGVDENGVVPADQTAQIVQALKNIERCLVATGGTIKDIVKLVYYIVGYDPQHRVHVEPLLNFLQGHRPATTLVPVPMLARPDLLFEVEAYVAVPQQPAKAVDVVVVGAGLSGLKAGYDVQAAGYSVAIVEARDRVGGKSWSVDDGGDAKFVDRGAAWINDTNQSEVYKLALALGVEMVVQNTTGKIVQEDLDGTVSYFPYGSVPDLPAHAKQDMIAIRDKLEALCHTLDIRDPLRNGAHLDKMSMEEWVKAEGGGETALTVATVWTRMMLGLELKDISALFFLNYCKSGGGLMQMRSDEKEGGQYLRFKRGTQSLSIGLAGLLKPDTILFSSPVQTITQMADGTVHVLSARGEFTCKRVIVSVPTPLYKEIRFEPPLPSDKAALASQNKLGFINKVILRYASPWWRAQGLCGMLQSFTGPISVARDTSVDDKGQFSLTCFLAGASGHSMTTMSTAERVKAVTTHINTTLGKGLDPAIVPQPVGFVEYEWAKDQWAQGCPCPAAPPGAMTQYEHALRSTHGKVHFVGTETSYEWKGYLDGALRSGVRGAQEVTSALAAPKL